MTKIDRIITKNFLKLTLLSLVGIIGLVILTQLNRALTRINDGSMTGIEGTLFLLSETPRTIAMFMPITALLGSLMTINKMAVTSEVVAIKTAGVSFKRILKFPLIAAIFLAILVAFIEDNFATVGRKYKRELKVKNARSLAYSKEASYNVYMKGQTGEYILNIGTVYADLGELYTGVLIFPDKNGDLEKIIAIEKATFDPFYKVWKGSNVYVKNLKNKKEDFYNLREISELKENPQDLIKQQFYMDEAKFFTLKKNATFIRAAGGNVKPYILEIHKRISGPILIIIISMLGFSLGSKYVRGGSAANIAIAVVLGYSTFFVRSMCEAFVKGGQLNPIIGAWLANVLFLAITIYTINEAEY